MMRLMGIVAALSVCVVLAGCDRKNPDSIMGKTVDKMEEMVTVMKGVQDEASSKAAAPKIKAIARDLKELKKEADAHGRITASEEKRLKEKYNDRIQKASMDGAKEGMRIGMNPKLMTPELTEAMQEMSSLNKK
jgi:hypothetical protein